jgi:hypothetical protein
MVSVIVLTANLFLAIEVSIFESFVHHGEWVCVAALSQRKATVFYI